TLSVGAATISPGVATLSVNASTANPVQFTATPSFTFQITDANGVAGVNWSLLRVPNSGANAVALPATFNVALVALDGTGNPGATPNWNNANFYTWTFFRNSGGFSGFAGTTFNIDTSQFTTFNSLGTGNFSVAQTEGGHALALSFNPV